MLLSKQFQSPLLMRLLPSRINTTTHRYRITSLGLIPSVVHQLVNHPGIEKIDFSSVQSMGSGAAYLPPELAAKLTAIAPKDATFLEGVCIELAEISCR
jgi:acyl-CoA synthetase (AMP-forming)/AMP-acid ligase II